MFDFPRYGMFDPAVSSVALILKTTDDLIQSYSLVVPSHSVDCVVFGPMRRPVTVDLCAQTAALYESRQSPREQKRPSVTAKMSRFCERPSVQCSPPIADRLSEGHWGPTRGV